MEFKEIVARRYSARKFESRRIPDAKVAELLDLVRQAPSALNLQPWKIKVITDPKLKEQLRAVSWNQEQVVTCSHLLVFCANTDLTSTIKWLDAAMKRANVPEEARSHIINLSSDMNLKMTPEQRLAFAQCQVYLAMSHALLGAVALGFDACPMGGFDPQGYTRILNLPANLVPTLAVPIGYATDKSGPRVRLPLKELVF